MKTDSAEMTITRSKFYPQRISGGLPVAIVMFMSLVFCFLEYRAVLAETPNEIYQRRIIPLLESNEKSSCSECHFRGMALQDYFASDPMATFARLRGLGWIDMNKPVDSKLLGFLQKQPKEGDKLLEKVRKAEYDAIRLWIEASSRDPEYRNAKPDEPEVLKLDRDFVLHSRRDQVETRFVDSIWSQLGRCVNCHSPERNAKQVAEHGEQMSWIVASDPGATLKLLVDRKLIDVDHPDESLIRTKPLELVEHGGGPKFLFNSNTDQQWLRFLQDYSKTVRQDGFRPGDDLGSASKRRSWLSELQVRITDLPAEWSERRMEIRLYRVTNDGKVEDRLVARGESSVNAKNQLWQNALTIYAAEAVSLREGVSKWMKPLSISETIPNGNYVIRVYLHDEGERKPDAAERNQGTWVGDFRVKAPWPPGYQPPMIVSWKDHMK